MGMVTAAAMAVRIQASDSKYDDIVNQFTKKWLHPTPIPQIHAVYRIYAAKKLRDQYAEYRAEVEANRRPKGHLRAKSSPGNEVRRFHATKIGCKLGAGSDSLCSGQDCAVCSICKTGFRINLAGSYTTWSRYGKGAYFSATSSKSNDYARTGGSRTTKAMFLVKVVAGRTIKLKQNSPNLTAPPGDYDAVVGEPASDSVLNYDELVTYRSDSALPSYLVVYG